MSWPVALILGSVAILLNYKDRNRLILCVIVTASVLIDHMVYPFVSGWGEWYYAFNCVFCIILAWLICRNRASIPSVIVCLSLGLIFCYQIPTSFEYLKLWGVGEYTENYLDRMKTLTAVQFIAVIVFSDWINGIYKRFTKRMGGLAEYSRVAEYTLSNRAPFTVRRSGNKDDTNHLQTRKKLDSLKK